MGLILLFYYVLIFLIWLFLTYGGIKGLFYSYTEPEPISGKRPRVLVMVPCKGTDIDLTRNLKSAMKQGYVNYKAVAIVESEADSAVASIKAAKMDYIIADVNCKKCSGKVKNLASAIRRFKDFDAYCIMDSDVHVGPDWLFNLVNQMDENTGMVTAFPTFSPVDGAFWSKVKHVWGFVGFGLMESETTRFGWGGTLLFRKSLIRGSGFDYFSESVSDDIALTKLCQKNGLSIAYAPSSRPIVDCKETFASLIEWSNRQTALSAYGNRKILYIGLVYYGANVLLLTSAIALPIFYSPLFIVLLAPFVINFARAYLRAESPDPSIVPIYLLINYIYFYNMLNACFTREIEWRGRKYTLE